jgi:hypothetical protein
MNDYQELARYIYERLNNNGAQLGNASIFIIETAINEFRNNHKTKLLNYIVQSKNCNQDK